MWFCLVTMSVVETSAVLWWRPCTCHSDISLGAEADQSRAESYIAVVRHQCEEVLMFPGILFNIRSEGSGQPGAVTVTINKGRADFSLLKRCMNLTGKLGNQFNRADLTIALIPSSTPTPSYQHLKLC